VVGSVTGSDPDAGDTLSYAITAGNTGGAFTIDAATGEITVATPGALDFETTPVFTLTVEVTDAGGLMATDTVTVNLTDENESPSVTGFATSLAENSVAGTVVGSVTGSDPDAGDTLSYAITAGNTGGAFTIDAVTGEITVATPAALDLETTPVFTLTVEVTDAGGLTATDTVTVNLTDQNESPSLTGFVASLPENALAGTVVGSASGSDPDAGDSLSYAITAGNTGGAFTIDAATGELTVASPAALDFETTPVFTLTVEVTDSGGLTATDTVTVNLTDQNESPSLPGFVASLAENTLAGTVVGSASGSDPDAGDSLGYAITAGNTGGAFTIDAATGEITVATPGAADFESSPVFTLDVEVSDASGLTATQTVTVNLTNVNESPMLAGFTIALPENSAAGTVMGFVSGSDPDAGDTLSYAITAGNGAGAFTIDPATGEITIVDASVLDFETTPSFTLTVAVTDVGGLAAVDTVTLDLTNVIEGAELIDPGPLPPEPPLDRPALIPPATTPPLAGVPPAPAPEAASMPPQETARHVWIRRPVAGPFQAPGWSPAPAEATEEDASLGRRPRAYAEALDPRLIHALDRLGADLSELEQSRIAQEDLIVATAEGAALVVSATLALLLLRASSLAAALLTSAPLWWKVDPLAILALSDDEREELERQARSAREDEDSDEEGIGRILDAAGA
jgi:hypothetical protein